MASFRGILIDIDGVLHVSMQATVGANETLHWLESQGYQVCFVTNTTTSSRATLVQKLRNIGLSLEERRPSLRHRLRLLAIFANTIKISGAGC